MADRGRTNPRRALQPYVALLRGVNVGRAKRIAMADWRALLESLGFGNVRTLLNSGNAVFDAPARDVSLAARIQRAIAAELSVETQVLVRTAGQVAAVVDGNELSALASDPSRMLVIFSDQPSRFAELGDVPRVGANDVLHVGRHAAYLWCPDGLLESPLATAALGRLGAAATTRNWATVLKLHAMLETSR